MRKPKRNYPCTTPFLLCLSPDRVAQVVEDLNTYQARVHNGAFELPPELQTPPEPMPLVPPDDEDELEETRRFMSERRPAPR